MPQGDVAQPPIWACANWAWQSSVLYQHEGSMTSGATRGDPDNLSSTGQRGGRAWHRLGLHGDPVHSHVITEDRKPQRPKTPNCLARLTPD